MKTLLTIVGLALCVSIFALSKTQEVKKESVEEKFLEENANVVQKIDSLKKEEKNSEITNQKIAMEEKQKSEEEITLAEKERKKKETQEKLEEINKKQRERLRKTKHKRRYRWNP